MIFTKVLEAFGNFVLQPFKNDGRLKLIIVMIIIPLFMNAIQVIIVIVYLI